MGGGAAERFARWGLIPPKYPPPPPLLLEKASCWRVPRWNLLPQKETSEMWPINSVVSLSINECVGRDFAEFLQPSKK